MSVRPSIGPSVRRSVCPVLFSKVDLMYTLFLDAPSHLYMRSCPSVRPSVRRSVCPSVRLSVCPSRVFFRRWKVRILGASCAVYPALFCIKRSSFPFIKEFVGYIVNWKKWNERKEREKISAFVVPFNPLLFRIYLTKPVPLSSLVLEGQTSDESIVNLPLVYSVDTALNSVTMTLLTIS